MSTAGSTEPTQEITRPTVQSKRLTLRPPNPHTDIDGMVQVHNDKSVYDATLNVPYPYTRDDAELFFNRCLSNPDSVLFAVVLTETNEFLGIVSALIVPRFQQAEFAWTISEEHRGKGYCTEAAQQLVEYLFQEKGLIKLIGRHFVSNPASGKVMAKLGMQLEGTLRQHVVKNGVAYDLLTYGLLRSEWEEKRCQAATDTDASSISPPQ